MVKLKMIKPNIVIVGGGTAGWLSALFAKKRYPDANVTVIESTEIGIIGAGEGTVPMLIKLFEYLDISLQDLILNTKATIKNGIKFTNWSEDGGSYFHGFTFHPETVKDLKVINFENKDFENSRLFAYGKKIKDEDFCFFTMISNENRVPYVNKENDYQKHAAHALHFDARILASFLKKKSLEREINHIDSKVINSEISENNVVSITLENTTTINTDFVVDATGFAKYFIGNSLGGKWISYSESLPANSAQAFFLKIENKEELEPYTECTATDYGWVWKIPLQHRYGCGYVYDSRFVSNEEVKKEIVKKYGDVEFVKQFKFDPGTFENIWIGNCIAVGLSAGFIEPLEATSLQQTTTTLNRVFHEDVDALSPGGYRDHINKKCLKDSEAIKDFIYLHYMTNKTNNDFWKNFTLNNKMPDSLKEIYQKIIDLDEIKVYDLMWPEYSYYIVANGNGIMNEDNLSDFAKSYEKFNKEIQENFKVEKALSKKCVKHYNFLKLNGGFSE
jgi:tryptophan halogenase